GLYHVRGHRQRYLSVGRPAAVADLGAGMLDTDVIAEEPRPLAAGVRDEGLVLVQFQSEGLPEKPRQLRLDLPGFGLRPGESQNMSSRVPCVFRAAVAGIHRVG